MRLVVDFRHAIRVFGTRRTVDVYGGRPRGTARFRILELR